MLSWPEFMAVVPDIATIGQRLLFNPDAGEVAILATVNLQGKPCVAPFCPIFTATGMFLLAARETPKAHHLAETPAYALHALLGTDDLEFQVSGAARQVTDTVERSVVIASVPFPSYDPTDPIFELRIERALSVSWPEPGVKQKKSWAAPLP